MAQLRFPGAQMLGRHLYRRSEGTLAYFFSTQAIAALAAAAGFEPVECEYARVQVGGRGCGPGCCSWLAMLAAPLAGGCPLACPCQPPLPCRLAWPCALS